MSYAGAGQFVVAVEELRISRKVKDFALRRMAQGLCLRCDCELSSMGLCSKHYQTTRLMLKRLPIVKRIAKAAELMRLGLYWDRELVEEIDAHFESNPLIDQEAAK